MDRVLFYSDRARYYDKLFRVSPWKKMYHRKTADLIDDYIPDKDCRILDAGGGTGLFSLPLALRGHRVTIIDSSSAMIDVLNEKVEALEVDEKVEIVRDDIEEASGYKSDTFDITLCTQVLNFLGERAERIIRELAEVTKETVIADVDSTYFWTMMEVLKGYPENALKIFRTSRDEVGRAVGESEYRTFDYDEIERILPDLGLKTYELRPLGNFVGFVHAVSESKEFLDAGPNKEGVERYLKEDVYESVVKLEEEARKNSKLKDTAQWIQFVYGKEKR